jgi:hypothetical protein
MTFASFYKHFDKLSGHSVTQTPVTLFSGMIKPMEYAPFFLPLEKVSVHSALKVLMEVDNIILILN